MNKHIEKILRNRDPSLSLLENITYYVSQTSEIDMEDMSSIIKKDKTFLEILEIECQKNNLLKIKPKKYFNINDLI